MSDHGAPAPDPATASGAAEREPGTTPSPGRSFGPVAEAYERGRPEYPPASIGWLIGEAPRTVLEIGAGTGKLTAALVAAGHDVHATDPDPAMLDQLSRRLPDVPVSVAGGEEIPAADASFDVVVCAQAFHWCDPERTLPEIARVLRPGGRLSLVWNAPDRRIPWVRRLHDVLGSSEHRDDLVDPVIASALFGYVEHTSFDHWQRVDRESVADLALSRSTIASLPAAEREEKVARVVSFYDDYGRGMDGMQIPYAARCYRSRLTEDAARRLARRRGEPAPGGAERAGAPAAGAEPVEAEGGSEPDGRPEGGPEGGPETRPGSMVSDGTGTDLLLIDFR